MRRSRHSEEQTVLKQAENCAGSTGPKRRPMLGGQVRRHGGQLRQKLRHLEEENRKLNTWVPELTPGEPSVEGHALQKLVAPCGPGTAAGYLMDAYRMSERHVCRLIGAGPIHNAMSGAPR